MIPVVSFIGWQNSGKTSIARQVVAILKDKGYRVAVIKSTHHTSIAFDRENSDTRTYCKASADSVTLIAPDQMVTITRRPEMKLIDIVHRFFYDVDIVIGEGFKKERHIDKIEVIPDKDSELLKNQVNGVVALVTKRDMSEEETVFHPDRPAEIANFIIQKYLGKNNSLEMEAILFVNGKKIPMKGFVQDALAGTVSGFIKSLKKTAEPQTIDVRIKLNNDK